jgi:signal peptidase I
MPNKSTDRRWRLLRGVAEALFALVLLGVGWTHGFVYVEGGSMQPALSAGDVVIYRRHVDGLRRGDLVLFEHGGSLVVHRVAGVRRDGSLRTRGDANRTLDAQPVPTDDVRGRIVLVIPAGRVASRVAALTD